MGFDEKVRFSIRTKRIIGTIGILPLIILMIIVVPLIQNSPAVANLIITVYVLVALAYVFLVIFVVGRGLKRKDQGGAAQGWLHRLIYSLDDTYERWSGKK